MGQLRVLSCGVDSLYFSVQGIVRDGWLEALEACRLAANGEPMRFEVGEGGTAFVHQGHGWRGYRHWLTCPGYDLMVGASPMFPPVYVQLRSEFIHEVGVSRALVEVVACLEAHFFDVSFSLGASRLDVYADVQGWEPRPSDFERFVTRATARTEHEGQGGDGELFEYGRRLSGFSFGRGDFVARIYDKRRQMAVTGKDWQTAVWKDEDPETPVWRIEFQARRPVLADVGVLTAEDAVQRRQGLWDYGTKWLSFREPSSHSRACRWPVSPLWVWLQQVQLGEPCEPLVRERARSADVRRLVGAWTGYSTSFAARQNLDGLGATSRRMGALALAHLDDSGRRFSTEVEKKRLLLLDRPGPGVRRGS